MQYLLVVIIRDHAGAPPAALQSTMTSLVEEHLRAGTFVITGGLAPDGSGVRLDRSAAGLVRSEPQLPIHGFAVVEARSVDEAAETAERFLEVHGQFVPGWHLECELRPIVTHCLP